MTGLLLRYSPGEATIRSVGDQPLSLSEAVEAAEGPETLGNLWFALSTSLVAAAKASVGDPRYLDAVDCLVGVGHEFLECVR